MENKANAKLNSITKGILSLATLAVSGQVWSEEAASQSSGVERIVVTAKNRAEPLQEVPLAINAFSEEELRNNQINEVRDLQDITPNLYLAGGNRNDPTAVGMRGLTPNTSDERYQGVSFFLDGIPLSGQLASFGFIGIDRIEVIKGPQAASFGRATYSGAINFVTATPDADETEGEFRASAGTVSGGADSSYSVAGSIETPLIEDKLWLNVGATKFQNGGVAEATDDGTSIGRERSEIVTAQLYYAPSDTLSVKFRTMYSHDEDTGQLAVIQHPRDWVESGADLITLPRASGSFYPSVVPDPDTGTIASFGAAGTARDRYFSSLIVTKDIADYRLIYSGGYYKSEDDRDAAFSTRAYLPGQDPVFGDVVGTDEVSLTFYAGFTYPSREIFKNTSHQLLLLSPDAQDLRWRAGLYYFWEEDETQFTSLASDVNPSGTARVDEMQNYAAFGGLDYDITDQLMFSAEGRIATEKVIYNACPQCTTPMPEEGSNSSTDFSPRLTLTYKLSEDNMIYGLYSSGIKSARLSRVVIDGVPQAIAAKPEELDNFELGSKNQFLDGKMMLNLAAFYQDVSDQQLTSSNNLEVGDQIVPLTYVDNVGNSEVYGFEAESKIAVTDNLSLSASVGYAHHEFVDSDPFVMSATSAWGFEGESGDPVSLNGKTQTNVPRWNGRLAGEYFVPDVYNNMSLSVRVDGNYRGEFYADLSNLVTVESAWTFNSRITLADDILDISLYGRNIFNQDRAIGTGLAGGSAPCVFNENNTALYGNNQLCLSIAAPRPAEFGVEVGYKF
ncbi:TonB-dependent receptor [Alteromonas sp. 1_MG-2023]|uniref:TonB-dependent receptor n=1 Tax=Alteromonas sp. 1_MG-2023 TaxID=3062669 RepID=UPI0026E1251C|nr:TonB-dependent receptor [Alteromonas sp. 1_MG-2023]MDO6475139.1 TonB-dependent receptor [Alteromonas sp. 1_MG-2023]